MTVYRNTSGQLWRAWDHAQPLAHHALTPGIRPNFFPLLSSLSKVTDVLPQAQLYASRLQSAGTSHDIANVTQSISRELRIAALQAFRPYFGRIPHNQDYFDFDENFGSRLNPNRTKQEYLQDMLGMAKESIQQFKERTEVIHSPLTAHYAKNSVSIALAQVADIMPDSGFYRAALEDATDTVGICALVQKVEARFNSLTV